MGAKYKQALDVFETVHVVVDFVTRRDEVIDYAVVLVGAGRQPAEVFHPGTLGEGMRMAIGDIQRGFEEMIDGWRRG